MKVGSTEQSVTVEASALTLNTTDASVSSLVDESTIKELPLNGRDPSNLVFLAPGVTNVLRTASGYNQTSDSFSNEMGASSGGGQQGSTYALLDGVPNMDIYLLLAAPFPNADSTQEFRAITNNFGAQYGFAPGAVISLETKSGTNQFHGGVFEFVRNGDLNASNWFSGAVDNLKRNQFGGFAGGPILKNKLFLFANYQATRQSLASGTETTFTPTAAMLKGDFSALPSTLSAPFQTVNGVPNQVDPSLFSTGAVAIATTALPLGQDPSTGEVTFRGPTVDSSYNEGTARLDYTISQSQRLFVRNFIQQFNYPAANIKGNMVADSLANAGKYYNEVVGHTWLPSTTVANTLTAAWINMYVTSGSQLPDINGDAVCLSRYINVADPPGCFIEGLNANGWYVTFAEPNGNMRTTWWLEDNFSKTLGNQLITIGGQLAHHWDNTTTDYPGQAQIGFNGSYTGYGNADFLLGDVAYMNQGAFQNSPVRGWQFALFAEDQYKVRKDVTITAGLRWEPDWAAVSVDSGAAWDPGVQSTRYPQVPVGLIFPGDDGLTSSLRPSSSDYFEPRVGIAWQPIGAKTVFRGGFGVFVAPISTSYFNSVVGIAPFAPFFALNGSPSSPISFQNPWAGFSITGGKSPFTSSTFAQNTNVPASQALFLTPISIPAVFAQNFRVPITNSWNVSVQREFSNTFIAQAAYVGSHSYHQTLDIDQNPGIYSLGGNRALQNFSNITQLTSLGVASYSALQATVDKKFSRGFSFHSAFTWSKNIDISSSGNITFHSTLPDPFDLGFNRGISDLNSPLISANNFVYVTPQLSQHNQLLKQAASGWEISGIWTFQSGYPFSIAGGDGNNNSGALQFGDRANSVPGQPWNVHKGSKSQWLNNYFNPNAFVPNTPGTFGNTGKNFLKGPGINSADLALSKNWQFFEERYKLQFRWEMFNAFNHPNFGQPDNSPTDPNFGQITGIGPIPPRVVQAGLKLTF